MGKIGVPHLACALNDLLLSMVHETLLCILVVCTRTLYIGGMEFLFILDSDTYVGRLCILK